MELLAYHNPSSSGGIMVTDLASPGISPQLFGDLDDTEQAIIVSFLSWSDQPSPLWRAAEEEDLLDEVRRRERSSSDPRDTFVPITLPYELVRTHLTDVVDLRHPPCQDWFRRTFGASELEKEFMEDSDFVPVDTFPEMLPSLLYPEPGGSMLTGKSQYIGSWLRRLGVSALVYPSARANASIQLVDGQIVDHKGWNLVDYHGAPPPQILHIDASFFGTPTHLPEGVQIVLPPLKEPRLQGSFIVTG